MQCKYLLCKIYSLFRGRPFDLWGRGWVVDLVQVQVFFKPFHAQEILLQCMCVYIFPSCTRNFFFRTCHVHKIFFSLSALAGHLFSKSPTPSEAEWSLPYAYIRFKLMQYIFVMRFSKWSLATSTLFTFCFGFLRTLLGNFSSVCNWFFCMSNKFIVYGISQPKNRQPSVGNCAK